MAFSTFSTIQSFMNCITSTPNIIFNPGLGYNPYDYPRGFKNGEFHHVVLTISGEIHTLYLDGIQVGQNPLAGNILSYGSSIRNTVIGAASNYSQGFQGNIGDVRVYNYTISPKQISNLYLDRNLVVYYPFDTSVNYLTPNYATLVYDASFIGTAVNISSNSNVGTGALSLTNSTDKAVKATNYVINTAGGGIQPPLKLNVSTGLTISVWINTTGITNSIMRIFDMTGRIGNKGLSVDISGTNMLYSSYVYYPFNITNISPSNATSFNVTSNNVKYYVFTGTSSNYTFTSVNNSLVNYIVVGGGGGGGSNHGGGGGAGGVISGTILLTPGVTYTVKVGAGGTVFQNGNDSFISGSNISTITGYKGGYGGGENNNITTSTKSAFAFDISSSVIGSGGGGTGYSLNGGSPNGGKTSSGQGRNGGTSSTSPNGGPGGGGAGGVGSDSTSKNGGVGGIGTAFTTVLSSIATNMESIVPTWGSTISNSGTYYIAGGGGGGSWAVNFTAVGGLGGGGRGGTNNNTNPDNNRAAIAALANTGGGGGGGGSNGEAGTGGGSGIVIIYG